MNKQTRRQTQNQEEEEELLKKENRKKKKCEQVLVFNPSSKRPKTTPKRKSPRELAKKQTTNQKLRDLSETNKDEVPLIQRKSK